MWSSLDDSPARIRAFLTERGIALKKRWGQNFMIERRARERVVDAAELTDREPVWEVGPGLGGITALLLERGARVTVFEVDHGLIRVLTDRFAGAITVVEGDAVKTLPAQEQGPDRFVGNLPYRSAAAIMTALLETDHLLGSLKRIVVTVQREMARRMVAVPGTADYSPFSVLCAITTRASLGGDLSAGNFYPAPDVVSSIVVLVPVPVDPLIRRHASVTARSLFSQRRKKISNNVPILARGLDVPVEVVRDALQRAGINSSERAERLPPEAFLEIARELRGNYSGRT